MPLFQLEDELELELEYFEPRMAYGCFFFSRGLQ